MGRNQIRVPELHLGWGMDQWFRGIERIHLCTAAIGILAASVFLVTVIGHFEPLIRAALFILSCAIFLWSVVSLYFALTHEEMGPVFLPDENQSALHQNVSLGPTRLELLNEEGTAMKSWELFDRVSLVIGKDMGENQVDIDLKGSVYASMIDVEHAVLNYANGVWYIEDLGSRNGVSVKKAGNNKEYRLSQTQPCKLDQGDIIFLGMTQLKIY